MLTLWNSGVFFVLAGVFLQSFCSLRLVFFSPMLNSIPQGVFDLSNPAAFILVWITLTFFSKIIGAYTFGKYAESKGFLNTQKILITGYVTTTALLFLCCLLTADFYKIKPLIVLIASFNILLFPATFMFAVIYLMKNYNGINHVKIAALVVLSALLGHETSYIVLNYVVKYDLQIMSGIFFGVSILCALSYCWGKTSVLASEKHNKLSTDNKKSSYLTKITAALVGSVCGSVVTHHYFFITPYVLNVLILKDSAHEQSHIFFYGTVVLFLVLALKVSDYITRSKLMIISLVGILSLTLSINMYQLSNIYVYFVYQTLLAMFFVGFLSPSLAFIFSLFKNKRPYFDGTFWFYIGVSLSFLSAYTLSKHFGPFNKYFLIMSPLVFSGLLCLGFLYQPKRRPVKRPDLTPCNKIG